MDNRSLTEMTNDVALPPLPGLPRSPATLAQWQPIPRSPLWHGALHSANLADRALALNVRAPNRINQQAKKGKHVTSSDPLPHLHALDHRP